MFPVSFVEEKSKVINCLGQPKVRVAILVFGDLYKNTNMYWTCFISFIKFGSGVVEKTKMSLPIRGHCGHLGLPMDLKHRLDFAFL